MSSSGITNVISSSGITNVINSPLNTPVSAKGGRAYNRSKASKGNRSAPQTPVSNAGGVFYHLKTFTLTAFICDINLFTYIHQNFSPLM